MTYEEAISTVCKQHNFTTEADALRYVKQEAMAKRFTPEIVCIVKYKQAEQQANKPTTLDAARTVVKAVSQAVNSVPRKLNNTDVSKRAFELAMNDGIDLRQDPNSVNKYMQIARNELSSNTGTDVTQASIHVAPPQSSSKIKQATDRLMQQHGFETPLELMDYVSRVAITTLKDEDVKVVYTNLIRSLQKKVDSYDYTQTLKLIRKVPAQFIGITESVPYNNEIIKIKFVHYDIANNQMVCIIENANIQDPMIKNAGENYGDGYLSTMILPDIYLKLPHDLQKQIVPTNIAYAAVYNKPDMLFKQQELYIPSTYNIYSPLTIGPSRSHIGDKDLVEQWQYFRQLTEEGKNITPLGKQWLRNLDMYQENAFSVIDLNGSISVLDGFSTGLVIPAFNLKL